MSARGCTLCRTPVRLICPAFPWGHLVFLPNSKLLDSCSGSTRSCSEMPSKVSHPSQQEACHHHAPKNIMSNNGDIKSAFTNHVASNIIQS